MFIELLQKDPQQYLMAVLTIVISIVLHELAHGWMAIRRGDDTPIRTGHMTGNPLVHMGPFSLAACFFFGIAWGSMPIDPRRLRDRYAEAAVAAAGPSMNLGLAFVSLTALGLWYRFGDPLPTATIESAHRFLGIFGLFNLVLAAFNLAPVPPLDGSRILENFHRGYARWLADNPQAHTFLFTGYFLLLGALNRTEWSIWDLAARACRAYLRLWTA